MKLKLDENLPESLARELAGLGHDIDTARGEGLGGQGDPSVWRGAQDAQRFLITQDLDFSDVRKFAPGTHCGILLVCLAVPGRGASRRVLDAFRLADASTWASCFVLLTDHKLRVKRPTVPPGSKPR